MTIEQSKRRGSRKTEHIFQCQNLADGPLANGFDDFSLVHNCLPEIAWDEVVLTTRLAGMEMQVPLVIEAMTGGAPDVENINAALAHVALATGCAMAVGSQFAAIEDPALSGTYRVVRDINPHGLIFANIGAYAVPEQAQSAVDMLAADALQVHLNVAQEIFMTEGERDFHGRLENIRRIVESVSVPVIVKEVGCGIAREQIRALLETGIAAVDVGGAGGTNFIAIEAARAAMSFSQAELSWGLPTALSLAEVYDAIGDRMDIVVSGGIRSALDIVKAFALGGSAVGIAAPLLRLVTQHGEKEASLWIRTLLETVRKFMLLAGAKNIRDLQHKPIVVQGNSRTWLLDRGIDPYAYAQRK